MSKKVVYTGTRLSTTFQEIRIYCMYKMLKHLFWIVFRKLFYVQLSGWHTNSMKKYIRLYKVGTWSLWRYMKHICSDISDKWSELKSVINEHSNDQIIVPFLSFEMQPHKTKKCVMKEKLTAVKRDANVKFVINFIDE